MAEDPRIPIQLGSAESFAAVRHFLRRADYREPSVVERFAVNGLEDFFAGARPDPGSQPEDALELLTRLFLVGEFAAAATVNALVPAEALEAMRALGLLAREEPEAGRWFAPVSLYPVGGLHLVSDRHNTPDGTPFRAPEDVVYPAITKNTRSFLHWLPKTPCKRLLDIGCGTGIAALAAVASGVARRAWATDIAARSTYYAEFNRRLNEVEPVTILTGDLYQPVADLRFDRIVTHPPYVPSFATRRIFRDGGAGGEEITRGVIAGAPEHLSPGGALYCLAMGMERGREKLEGRVRQWLGRAGSQFDVLVVEMQTFRPEQVASQAVAAGHRHPGEFQKLLSAFAEAEVEQFVYGLIVIRRLGEARRPLTLRRKAGSGSSPEAVAWLLEWEARAGDPSLPERLLSSRPVALPDFELRVSYRFLKGELVPSDFQLSTGVPFDYQCHIQPWTARLIGVCDGSRTGRQLYEYCRRENLIRDEVSPTDFTGLLRALIAGGFIQVEGLSFSAEAE